MSMVKPTNVQEFERLTGYKVLRNLINQDTDDERFVVEVEIGGKDEDGFYLLVLDGPAEGEKGYL